MANLNYLLLKVLQDKTTKENALDEINDFIVQNTPKLEPQKDTEKWLTKFGKDHPQRAVLSKVNYENDLQIMTDMVLMVARSKNYYLKGLSEAKADEGYPSVAKILNTTLTKPYKINLKQLYNASQLFKVNDSKISVDLFTNGLETTIAIEVIERAYKLTGIEEATIQFVADKNASMKPLYITSKDKNGTIQLVITPMRVGEKGYQKDLYLTNEGNIELLNSDKVVKVSLEAPKPIVEVAPKEEAKKEVAQAKETPTKVFPRVRGIKTSVKGEKATRKQLSYLLLLSGRQYDENMTKAEASKEITRLKLAQLDTETCEA